MSRALPSADIVEIVRHIPHRFPFLLIDRMEACEPHQWVRVLKNVSHGEVGGHGLAAGPGRFPQLLLVEALAQAAGTLCHFSGMMSTPRRSIMFFAGIDNCRFSGDAVAGDQVILECVLRRALRGVVKLHGKATVEGRILVEADLTAVIRDVEAA
jgi:3-hydroxyacyl-[acyl-carrier-protein] dehydratase